VGRLWPLLPPSSTPPSLAAERSRRLLKAFFVDREVRREKIEKEDEDVGGAKQQKTKPTIITNEQN
jgi:hypothetical protein